MSEQRFFILVIDQGQQGLACAEHCEMWHFHSVGGLQALLQASLRTGHVEMVHQNHSEDSQIKNTIFKVYAFGLTRVPVQVHTNRHRQRGRQILRHGGSTRQG